VKRADGPAAQSPHRIVRRVSSLLDGDRRYTG
jgi:hypothetical protein